MIINHTASDNLIRNSLRGNALFSAISGALLVLDAAPIATFMGVAPALPFVVLGVVLLLHAANIYFGTRQRPIKETLAWFAVAGDGLWVAASALVLLADPFGFSGAGKWATLIVADLVLVFAVVQVIGIRRMRRQ